MAITPSGYCHSVSLYNIIAITSQNCGYRYLGYGHMSLNTVNIRTHLIPMHVHTGTQGRKAPGFERDCLNHCNGTC